MEKQSEKLMVCFGKRCRDIKRVELAVNELNSHTQGAFYASTFLVKRCFEDLLAHKQSRLFQREMWTSRARAG